MDDRSPQPPWMPAPPRTRRWLGLAFVLGLAAADVRPALAQEPPVEDPDEPAEGSFLADLESAKAQYFQGDLDQSLLAFRALQLRYAQTPDLVDFDDAVEALTYLGEILVKQGQDEEASRVFRTILERDIDLRISPYHHPADVVFVFNRVREQVAAERAAEVPEEPIIPPAPATSYLPLGLPQLARGRVGPGILYGGGQVVLGGAAIGTYLHLRVVNRPDEDHPLGWDADQIVARSQSRRYGLQWPATIGFYTLWIASVVDARVHWNRSHARPQARWTPLVLPPGRTPAGAPRSALLGVHWGPTTRPAPSVAPSR